MVLEDNPNTSSLNEQLDWREALSRTVLPPLLFAGVSWLALGVSGLLSHVLAEMLSLVVALAAMGVATTSARFARNHFAAFVSIAIGWCGGIDLLHVLMLQGMHLFPGDTSGQAAQLSIATQFMQAVALLLSPWALRRRFSLIGLHLTFGLSAVAIMAWVLSGRFPDVEVPGQGLTPFMIHSGQVVLVLFGLAVLGLWHARSQMTQRTYLTMVAATLALMLTSVVFTLDNGVMTSESLIGHSLKIVAYWLVYIAMVRNTIREPFVQLQDEIQERQFLASEREMLLNDLKERVSELRCINAVSELLDRVLPLEETLDGLTTLLPSGFVLPAQVRVSIQSDWGNFGAGNWEMRPNRELVQPLLLEERVVGKIRVWYPDELTDAHAYFLQEEEALLRNVARQLCDAIKRLHASERVERLRYLYEMQSATSRSVVHSQSREALLKNLHDALIAHGTFPLLYFAETSGGGWPMRLGQHHGVPEGVVPVLQAALQDDRSRLVEVLDRVQYGRVDARTLDRDEPQEPPLSISEIVEEWRTFLHESGVNYRAVLPLRCEGRLEGVVVLFVRGLKPFDEEQLRLLQEIADEMGFALDKLARQSQLLESKRHTALLELRFQEVFQASPVPMQLLALDAHHTHAINTALEQWLGYVLSDIALEDDWFNRLYPEDLNRDELKQHWQQSVASAKRGESVQSPEMTLRCKDGSTRIARGTMTVVGQEAIVAWTDLTEIRRSEVALRESERRFRTMVEQTLTAMFVRRDGRFIYVNPRFLEISGWQASDLVGKSVLDFTAQDAANLAQIRQAWQKLHDGQHLSVSYTAPFRRKDGQLIQFGLTAKNIVWDDGAPATIVMAADITEKMRAEHQIAAYVKQLEAAMRGTLQAVSNMVEMRDPYTAGHERRVGLIASAIAREMGWNSQRCDNMEMLGLVHDIGKIAIPSEILTKPTRLTPLEMEMMKEHPQAGYEILKNVPFPMPVAEIIRQHHERMDGSGYPRALKGEDILPEARVLAVADVLESMATHRPYRPAVGLDAALAEVENHRGTLYAPEVVDAVVRLIKDKAYQLPA